MNIRGYHFSPRLWPTLMTIPILVMLILLGNWQVARLSWKLDLIQKIEDRYGLPAAPLPARVQEPDDWAYRHVTVSGRFLYMREMPIYGIGPNGQAGYDLFTPLFTGDGHYVIVNRGWVPEKFKQQMSRPETIKSGKVDVVGILRKSHHKERFAPENDPDRNSWYYGDVKAMAKAQDLENVFPMFLYEDKSSDDRAYPIGGRSRLTIVNNHLDYAMTWYGLAIVLFVIYLIFNIRKPR